MSVGKMYHQIDISEIGNEPHRRINPPWFDGKHLIETKASLIEASKPDQDPSTETYYPVIDTVSKELVIELGDGW